MTTYAISTTVGGGYPADRSAYASLDEVLEIALKWAPTQPGEFPLAGDGDDIRTRLAAAGKYEYAQVTADLMDDFFLVERVTTYVNLTPHRVVVYSGNTVIADIPTSGTIARLAERVEVEGRGLNTWTTVRLDDAEGLPAPENGVVYVVSMPLAMGLLASGPRDDVVYPYGQVRDEAGRIVGCRGFARIVA